MRLHIILLSLFLLGCLDKRSLCEQTSDPNVRDRCMSSLALSDMNTTECGNVKNATAREYCIMKIAIFNLDESQCASMQTSLVNQCRQVVERIKINNTYACLGISDNDTAEVCRIRVG